MMSMRDIDIFPIKEDKVFEELCLDLYKSKLDNPQLNGRLGQRQKGVDIFGRKKDSFDWIGIQCKVKSKSQKITEKEIENEIEKAIDFNPKLSEYIIITTAPRDAKIQEFVRIKSEENKKNKLFSIEIHSWDDIILELRKESNINLLHKYYKDFFIDVKLLNNVIGRIIEISIGVANKCDTKYELLIGKTPDRQNDEDCFGLNYYKSIYFIINLSNRTMEIFSMPCCESDFRNTFVTTRDAYIVAKWLSCFENINDIIYGDIIEYKSLITQNEYEEFLNTYMKS